MTCKFFYFCDVYFLGGNWKEGEIVPYLDQTIEKQRKKFYIEFCRSHTYTAIGGDDDNA